MVLAPLLVALPPVRQTPVMLAAARVAGKLARLFSVALTLILAVQLWRTPSAGTLATLLLAMLCAVLSRVNVMEKIFPGVRRPETSAIGELQDIDETDMVIGCHLSAARAGPIRCATWPTITCSTTGSAKPRCCPIIERSATPVWCGTARWMAASCVSAW